MWVKYLGTFISKPVEKHLKEYDAPAYASTMAYTRAGNYISLVPDEAYFQKFPQDEKNVFANHFHPPYIYLAEKLDLKNNIVKKTSNSPNGNWELQFIADHVVEKLFPGKKPLITIDGRKVSGNTGCNSFNGAATIEDSNIQFAEALAMTKMMCQGTGEQTFLQAMKKVSSWKMDEEGMLVLSAGNSVIMKLVEK